jgi:hypothetical protein
MRGGRLEQGSATEVLLDAIRVGHPDAPAKEARAEPALGRSGKIPWTDGDKVAVQRLIERFL